MRVRLGAFLRAAASHVDPEGDMRLSGLSFTFERGVGYVLHGEPGVHKVWPPEAREPGCPLMYHERDYGRAHTEAINPT